MIQQCLFCSLFDSWWLAVEHDEVEIQLSLDQNEGKKHLLIASASAGNNIINFSKKMRNTEAQA